MELKIEFTQFEIEINKFKQDLVNIDFGKITNTED